MNKIKLMHDVVKTMKAKESVNGRIKAEGNRDRVEIFRLDNQFQKNSVTGEGRVKMSVAFDYNGETVKHESDTAFTMKDGCQKFHRHMHGPGHCFPDTPGRFPSRPCHELHCGGLKEGLSRVGLVLHIFNEIQLEEREDQTYLLSLAMNDLPEELKSLVHEKMNREEFGQQMDQAHHCLFQEIHRIEKPDFRFSMAINKNYEVESVQVSLQGRGKDDNQEEHQLEIRAELNLNW